MGINVLSLFDGMSCGQQALERAGIKVDNYFLQMITQVGKGLFAKKDVAKGDTICLYTGKLIDSFDGITIQINIKKL